MNRKENSANYMYIGNLRETEFLIKKITHKHPIEIKKTDVLKKV